MELNRRDFIKIVLMAIGGLLLWRWLPSGGKNEKPTQNLHEAKYYSSPDTLLG